MDRRRVSDVPYGVSRWQRLFVFLGGLLWSLSIAGQLAWDGFNLVPNPGAGELTDEDVTLSVSRCLQGIVQGAPPFPTCSGLADSLAGVALALGVVSVWWNPRLQEKLTRVGGRITGKAEFYKLQAILLAARSLAFWWISNDESNPLMTKGVHGSMLFFGILVSQKFGHFTELWLTLFQSNLMSFRAIKVDYTPRVVFQDTSEPLTSPQAQLEAADYRHETPSNFVRQLTSYSGQRSSNPQPFSINDFAPLARQQNLIPYQSPYRPPTPPPEEDYEAMDWTPSQQATLIQQAPLKPATFYRPLPSATQPSPFHGHLPADVVSMEHRLRNPPNKPTFRKASESTKQNFSRTPKTNSYHDYDTMSEATTEYEPSIAETATPATTRFADPKLRLQAGQDEDTGLEQRLANTFYLEDEPNEVRTLRQQQMSSTGGAPLSIAGVLAQYHRLSVSLLLIISFLLWRSDFSLLTTTYGVQTRLATLALAGMASVRSLVLLLCKDAAFCSGSDLLIFIAETGTSIALGYAIEQDRANSVFNADSAGSVFIAIMAIQEIWLFFLDSGSVRKNTDILDPPVPVPARSTESTTITQQTPSRTTVSQKTTSHLPNSADNTPEPPHITRSMTKGKRASIGNGFGSLSLGDSESSNGLDGVGSLSLGQPTRRNWARKR